MTVLFDTLHPQGQTVEAKAAGAPVAHTARASRSDLIAIIEGEIIPRLFLAHRDRTPHRLAEDALDTANMDSCSFLAGLLLSGDSAEVIRRIEDMLQGGIKRDRIYRDLLAPVPQTLSQFWSEGRCSFEEIATGLRCIDEVLAELHAREGLAAAELH